MSAPSFSIKIGGEAGQGIKSAGLMLAKLAARAGLNIYNYLEYPSLIRGGHNVMQVNISKDIMSGPYKKCDFLIALNQEAIDRHLNELTESAGVLIDVDKNLDTSKLKPSINLYPTPLSKIAREAKGLALLSNTVALGTATGILGGSVGDLLELIQKEFNGKGPEITQMNLAAAQVGYEFALANFSKEKKSVLKKTDDGSSLVAPSVINGNEACALGAISAGLDFAAIYPMSPISPILATLAQYQEKYDYVYKQPEDEISAINMAIGASFGGARSMTATSGGGFCLMTEAYGLAGMTETPLVIIEGMRGGPATGLPTWSEQGDLQMVLHAHQGDFPRIVLAPGDAKEAFELTMQAFNLAEIYQTPVVVLIDKNICDNDQNFPLFDTSNYRIVRGKLAQEDDPQYRRYKIEEDGISTRAFAGSGNFFIANSDEHDEFGYTTEDVDVRNKQVQKRMQKLQTCAQNHMQKPQFFGPKEADLTIVSWGSNKGSILQALSNYPNVNYVHLTWMSPFPARELTDMLTKARRLLNIECNFSAQMGSLIKEQTGVDISNNLLKYDGRPFFVEEISKAIERALI